MLKGRQPESRQIGETKVKGIMKQDFMLELNIDNQKKNLGRINASI